MTERCAHCPAPTGAPCVAQVTRHWRYCELVDPGGPHYNSAYLPIVAGNPNADRATVAARRAAKPRIQLGQKPPPPPDCVPCNEKQSTSGETPT